MLVTLRIRLARKGDERAQKAFSMLSQRAFRFSTLPVGVLQLPLGFVLRLGRLTARPLSENPERELQEWGFEFGKRLDERVSIAKAARLQWRQLHCRLLPIEPEALLAIASWGDVMRRAKVPWSAFEKTADNLPERCVPT